MGDHGRASRPVDQLDRLLGAGPASRHEGLGARHQVLLEEGAEVRARAGRARDVRTADRVRGAGLGDGGLEGDLDAVGVEPLDDLAGSLHSLPLGAIAGGRDRVRVHPVAEHVQIVGVGVDARHLHRRHAFDSLFVRGGDRLRHPRHRVVVGQRHHRDARSRCRGRHRRRLELPVRYRRVRL
jgi:hypothetical protein